MSRTDGDAKVVGADLPRIADVRAADKLQVEVAWQDGAVSLVDLAPDIMTFEIYAPLRDNRELFGSVTVGDDGNALHWGNGAVDMPATAVERLAGDTPRSLVAERNARNR